MTAQPLTKQFLPAIAVLRHRRIRVGLPQRQHSRAGLLVGRVHTRGRGVEESFDFVVAGGEQHVGVDHHGQHAIGLVRLDEAHAAHVCRKVEDEACAPDCLVAGRLLSEIQLEIFRRGEHLVPVLDGLDIDRTDLCVPLSEEVRHEMAPDEATAASHHNQITLVHTLTLRRPESRLRVLLLHFKHSAQV